jgi:hypothetical protein
MNSHNSLPKTEMKIGLVTPVLNNFRGYCELIRSLLGTTVFPVILDNWNFNRGVAVSWNEGTKQALEAGCSHVLITNDDTMLVFRGAYDMARRLDKCDEVILVSARQQKGNERFDHTIDGLEHMKPPKDYVGSLEGDSPDFSCFMITQRTIDEVGWFDENFKPGCFEDNDYHHRIHLAGFIAANMANVPHWHRGSQTLKSSVAQVPVITNKAFEANRYYYGLKWGGQPGLETFSTPFNDGRSFRMWDIDDRKGY